MFTAHEFTTTVAAATTESLTTPAPKPRDEDDSRVSTDEPPSMFSATMSAPVSRVTADEDRLVKMTTRMPPSKDVTLSGIPAQTTFGDYEDELMSNISMVESIPLPLPPLPPKKKPGLDVDQEKETSADGGSGGEEVSSLATPGSIKPAIVYKEEGKESDPSVSVTHKPGKPGDKVEHGTRYPVVIAESAPAATVHTDIHFPDLTGLDTTGLETDQHPSNASFHLIVVNVHEKNQTGRLLTALLLATMFACLTNSLFAFSSPELRKWPMSLNDRRGV